MADQFLIMLDQMGRPFVKMTAQFFFLGIKDHWLLLHSLHFIIIFCTVTPCVHQSLTLILISC